MQHGVVGSFAFNQETIKTTMPIRKVCTMVAQEFELETTAVATGAAAARSVAGFGGRSTASTTSSTAGSAKMGITILRSPPLRPGPEPKKGKKREVLTMPMGTEPLATIAAVDVELQQFAADTKRGSTTAAAESSDGGGAAGEGAVFADDESVGAARKSREKARARARREYGYEADLGQDNAAKPTLNFPSIASFCAASLVVPASVGRAVSVVDSGKEKGTKFMAW